MLLICLDLERQRVLLARVRIAVGPRTLQRTLGLLAITIDLGVVVPPDDDPPSTGRRIRGSPDYQNIVDGLARGGSPQLLDVNRVLKHFDMAIAATGGRPEIQDLPAPSILRRPFETARIKAFQAAVIVIEMDAMQHDQRTVHWVTFVLRVDKPVSWPNAPIWTGLGRGEERRLLLEDETAWHADTVAPWSSR